MSWPFVYDEDVTLNKLIDGFSIARFGDGEFNLALGGNCITQIYSIKLSKALKRILWDPKNCLVGIPRINTGPKQKFWSYFNKPEIIKLFGQKEYSSAFITRPDSAPWIDRADYWNKVKRLWRGKVVALVRGSEKSLTATMLEEAAFVKEVIVDKRNAFDNYHRTLHKIEVVKPDIAILCCGPTATVMAHELAGKGIQAVDLGHLGMFLNKHHRGESMKVTAQDKAWDKL